MKRILAILICLSTLLCAGCSSDRGTYVPTGNGLASDDDSATVPDTQDTDEAEQELVLVYYPTESMNPLTSTDFTNRTLFSLIYQGLFTVDRDYNVEPMLCKNYTVSDDMRSYTFYVESATFSDGSLLTAQDVLATFEAARSSDVYKGRFLHVTQIALTADGGILFSLDTAYENFPLLLDIPIVKATEVEAERPLGTGPYYLEQTTGGLRLRRRTGWWCQSDMLITASSIPLRQATDPTQIRDAFEFEDVGLVCTDPGSDSYADYRCDYELWDCESGIFLYLACNTASEIFSNTAVRSALTYAIDRDTLVEKYYRGFARSATLPASPLSPYYSLQLAGRYGYDAQRFSQVIADQGLTGTTVRLLVNKNDTLRLRVARAIRDMLEAGGLKVEMLEMSTSDYLYTLAIGDYDLYLGQTRLSPNMDLSAFFAPSGALRSGGLADAGLYSLCLQSLANRGNYFNLHQKIMDDGRLVPMLFRNYSVHATRGLLTGLTPSRDNVFYYSLGRTMADALIIAE